MTNRRPWAGGYVRAGKRRDVYVIDRWVKGVHFHISTRCSSERAALKQLERFEADPAAYTPAGSEHAAVTFTDQLADEFRAYMRERKGNTPEWTAEVMRHLAAWSDDLAGADLRTLSIPRLEDILDRRQTSRRHRIEALKAFCTWLRRRKGLLTPANDVTMSLEVPKAAPAQQRKRRAIPEAHVRAVLAKLPEETRDVCIVQSGTAWHISEVRRFAESGQIVSVISGKGIAALVTRHKSNDEVTTPLLHQAQLEAAKRIKARGRIPIKETIVNHLRRACEAVREEQRRSQIPEGELMPHFRLGQMRHTVLTWGVEDGATIGEAAGFANHRSERTTRRFYVASNVPSGTIPTRKLD